MLCGKDKESPGEHSWAVSFVLGCRMEVGVLWVQDVQEGYKGFVSRAAP